MSYPGVHLRYSFHLPINNRHDSRQVQGLHDSRLGNDVPKAKYCPWQTLDSAGSLTTGYSGLTSVSDRSSVNAPGTRITGRVFDRFSSLRVCIGSRAYQLGLIDDVSPAAILVGYKVAAYCFSRLKLICLARAGRSVPAFRWRRARQDSVCQCSLIRYQLMYCICIAKCQGSQVQHLAQH